MGSAPVSALFAGAGALPVRRPAAGVGPPALFELTTTYAEDDEKRERCNALAAKLGRDREALFFGARL